MHTSLVTSIIVLGQAAVESVDRDAERVGDRREQGCLREVAGLLDIKDRRRRDADAAGKLRLADPGLLAQLLDFFRLTSHSSCDNLISLNA